MKILIEQYGYAKGRLSAILDPHYFTELRDGKAKIPYVGYFLSHKIPDMVFILPKVFIIYGKAFGEYDPEEIIDFDNLNPEHKANVFNLSVWLYRAIKLYFQRKDKIGDESEILQNVVSHQGPRSETMIDIVLSLLKFDKEHKNLFAYITRLKHSGQNKIHWQKTISQTQALIQNGVPIYLQPHTKQKDINFDEELDCAVLLRTELPRSGIQVQCPPSIRVRLAQTRGRPIHDRQWKRRSCTPSKPPQIFHG